MVPRNGGRIRRPDEPGFRFARRVLTAHRSLQRTGQRRMHQREQSAWLLARRQQHRRTDRISSTSSASAGASSNSTRTATPRVDCCGENLELLNALVGPDDWLISRWSWPAPSGAGARRRNRQMVSSTAHRADRGEIPGRFALHDAQTNGEVSDRRAGADLDHGGPCHPRSRQPGVLRRRAPVRFTPTQHPTPKWRGTAARAFLVEQGCSVPSASARAATAPSTSPTA